MKFKLLIIALFVAVPAWAGCGTLAVNPVTGQLDCVGSGGGGSATVQGSMSFYVSGAAVAGTQKCTAVPFAATITGWVVSNSATASIQFDIWKIPYSTTLQPTIANTIVAAAPPVLSGAKASSSTTLTGWTTSVSAKDIICFVVTSATAATDTSLVIQVTHQ